MKMRQADFDLGQPLISSSTATVETILEMLRHRHQRSLPLTTSSTSIARAMVRW